MTGESLPLAVVVETAAAVAATSSRSEKSEHLANILRVSRPAEAPIVVGLLTGEVRQGRIGVGWAALKGTAGTGSGEEPVTLADVDLWIDDLAATSGPGSQERKRLLLDELFDRTSTAEHELLRNVLSGGLRQGALDGVMTVGIAKATDIPQALVRRAAMLSGDLGEVAALALGEGRPALEALGLRVGRGVLPMLAATSASAAEAIVELGLSSVQAKLDGIRLQVHRHDDEVRLFTRNLNDVTERLPAVVSVIRDLDVRSVVLDAELIGVSEDSPEMFQDTASTFSSSGGSGRVELGLRVFDIIHRDGVDLIDEPLSVRLEHLLDVVGDLTIDGVVTDDPAEAETFAARTLAAGHEGVMVKAIDSPYAAGRRGKTWRKVKPVHTYDLVVLAVEWGHGRRTGWLSNLHLGALDGDDFVMVGKTFKGLTDELLAWQTEALLELETHREGIAVFVQPELVVEIAIDGVQRSTTYDGGLALRFARVKQYRPDKSPTEADTLEDLRALL
ncbi:MAG: ATP-dependent DNA ligase [Acidimicrobiales bacterium]